MGKDNNTVHAKYVYEIYMSGAAARTGDFI